MEIITDDHAIIEQMQAMAEMFGASLIVENMGDGRFRLTMSEEDRAKLPSVD